MEAIKIATAGVLAVGAAAALAVTSAAAPTLGVSVDSFKNGGVMPNKYAFLRPGSIAHRTGGPNLNPKAPAITREAEEDWVP